MFDFIRQNETLALFWQSHAKGFYKRKLSEQKDLYYLFQDKGVR